MAGHIRISKLSKLMYAIFLFGIFLLLCHSTRAYAAEISVDWSNVSLGSDGDCSWAIGYTGSLEVDKYELRLARKSNGTWSTSYKSAKTSDTNYSFSFSATGQYYYVVRALFVGGDKSTWSGQSNIVSVKSEDIDRGTTPDASSAYYIVPTNGGNYVVPAGPGVSGYAYQTTTIGPGGSVTTNSYGTSAVGNTPVYGYGPGTSATTVGGIPAGTITGDNGAAGWVRDGNRWRYRYANNTFAANAWDKFDGSWYYFDNNGYMATGWVYYNNNWYLCGTDGRMRTGWNMVNNKWYYMDGSGIMQSGYITVDGIKYFCDSTGARVQGGYNPDGHYFDESGVMIK